MKPLIIIPARGGSKGLPGKNIKYLAGKPLIQYTIEAALGVFAAEQICVSTDSLGIKNAAESLGLKVPFLRPYELSTDTASSRDVINHALEFYQKKGIDIDLIVLLQPTSPFRNSAHINKALLEYDESIDMVVSVQETASNPYYVLKEENSDGFLMPSKKANFTRRQDCPPVYEYNGAIYLINPKSILNFEIEAFKKVRKYKMSKKDSVDLDDPIDWMVAEALMIN